MFIPMTIELERSDSYYFLCGADQSNRTKKLTTGTQTGKEKHQWKCNNINKISVN